MITPNRAELALVTGSWKSEEDLTEKAQNLREHLGLEALLLTRSEEGMTLYTREGALTVPAQAREVFDVSGAGDTVIAVLASMLAAGMSMPQAVHIANRAGGIVVGKLGTASVSYEELFGTTYSPSTARASPTSSPSTTSRTPTSTATSRSAASATTSTRSTSSNA